MIAAAEVASGVASAELASAPDTSAKSGLSRLISAELGGAFADRRGGIYTWVAEAFGTRWGFLAIWLQWIQNVVWFPVALTFGAAALAYTIGRPEPATNGVYVGIFCIVAYWPAT